MIDEKITDPEIAQVEFDWERVKNKAMENRDKLITNTPKVMTRDIPTTGTTDMRVEPDILPSEKGVVVYSDTRTRYAEPQVVVDDDGPDKNVIQIVKGIKEEKFTGKDITIDERRLVVKSLKLSGQSQDAIAELLNISRRTIVNDYKVIRQEAALSIATTETNEIAGEVYAVAKTCIRKAMAAGHFKTVSTITRDMVELLQSIGLVYRAPKASVQASLIGSLNSKQGYHKYMDAIGDDKNKVIDVLDCMFEAITKDQVN